MSEEITITNVNISSDNHFYPATMYILKALDEQQLKYKAEPHNKDDGFDIIQTGFVTDNTPSLRITIAVHEQLVSIYAFDVMKFTNVTPEKIYRIIQQLHRDYTFARWVFDESDNTIQAEWFGRTDENIEFGRFIRQNLCYFVMLVDDAYSTLIKMRCAMEGDKNDTE